MANKALQRTPIGVAELVVGRIFYFAFCYAT